jgi:hypothetical protein
VNAGALLGLQAIQVRPKRKFATFTAQVVVEEVHRDELVITDHPVETGARISDHAFLMPSEVVLTMGWSNSPSTPGTIAGIIGAVGSTISGISSLISGNSASQVKQVYENLLNLQKSRIPFEIQTGKRIYQNMLLRSLRVVTNKESENSLLVEAVCREVLLVAVQVVTVGAPASAQADPAATQSPIDKGIKSLVPASALNAASAAQSFAVRTGQAIGIPLP